MKRNRPVPGITEIQSLIDKPFSSAHPATEPFEKSVPLKTCTGRRKTVRFKFLMTKIFYIGQWVNQKHIKFEWL